MQHFDAEEDEKYWRHLTQNHPKAAQEPTQIGNAFELVLMALRGAEETAPREHIRPPQVTVVRRTRRGRMRKEVRDIYLHEEFPCGVLDCGVCQEVEEDAESAKLREGPILIVDGPLAASEVDFLWDDVSVNNVVILQSVLDEVREKARRRNYRRLLRLCGFELNDKRTVEASRRTRRKVVGDEDEVPPDRRFYLFPNTAMIGTFAVREDWETDDQYSCRLLQRAAAWYRRHRSADGDAMEDKDASITILTTSAARKNLLAQNIEQGVSVRSLDDWIAEYSGKYPTTGEKLIKEYESERAGGLLADDDTKREAALQTLGIDNISGMDIVARDELRKTQAIYPAHLSSTVLAQKVRDGKAFQGVLKTAPTTCWKASVVVDRTEIRVAGSVNINRAVDGDVVVVELLDEQDVASRQAVAVEDARLDGVGEIDLEDEQNRPNLQNIKPDRERYLGRVIGIVQRNWHTYCGSLLKGVASGTQRGEDRKFVPASPKIPPFIIRTHQAAALEGRRLVACMDHWDRFSLYPRGHWIEDLGQAGEDATEAKVILREHNVITREFPPSVLRCLPARNYEVGNENLSDRLDIRLKKCFCDPCRLTRNGKPIPGQNDPKLAEFVGTPCIYYMDKTRTDKPLTDWLDESVEPFKSNVKRRRKNPKYEEYEDADHLGSTGTICCSIDPPTCVDIDDSLSVKFLKNGNYEVGVHIADVTHYVRADTAIDAEAAERCTTVYLVNQRTDMLPKRLSADICSLKSGVDRLSFSVFWEMTPNGKVKHTRFHKTIMHAVAAFNYQQAQDLIDCQEDQSPIAVRLRVLNELAKKLRKKRMDGGAVELAASEVKFTMDDAGNPVEVEPYPVLDTHHLVEEFMLLANMAVAEKIYQTYPECAVLRRHPPPKAEGLTILAKVLAKKGIEFKFGSSSELANSLDKAQRAGDPEFNRQLRAITVQYMNQAVYFCTGDVKDPEQMRHYALASSFYTHFTSPIRRYADVLVHRLLAAALGRSSLPISMAQVTRIVELCDRMTERHRNAQFCGRDSTAFYAYKLFSRKKNLEVRGIVTSVRANGCLVHVPEWGVDGQATVDSAHFKYNPEDQHLESLTTPGETIGIFDYVAVQVEASDEDYRFRVSYVLLHKLQPQSERRRKVHQSPTSRSSIKRASSSSSRQTSTKARKSLSK